MLQWNVVSHVMSSWKCLHLTDHLDLSKDEIKMVSSANHSQGTLHANNGTSKQQTDVMQPQFNTVWMLTFVVEVYGFLNGFCSSLIALM